MKIILKKLCFDNKYNTCFNVSVLDGNLYYLCVCNKGDKIWYIFINIAKKTAKLRVCRDTPTQKNRWKTYIICY